MVYGRVGYCPLSCFLYTLTSLCSNCRVLASVVTGKDCLLVDYAMQMILLSLPLQLMYLVERWRYALSSLLKGIWCSMPAGKTQLMCFCRHKSIVVDDCIEFCGHFSNSISHLGHILSCDLPDSSDIENNLFSVPTASSCTSECAPPPIHPPILPPTIQDRDT